MPPEHLPLEPSPEALRRMIDQAAERIIDHIVTLPQRPASYRDGGAELAREVAEELPRTGAPLDELLDLVFDRLVDKSFNNPGPGFLAFIPGGGLVESALADLVAGTINRYVTVWLAAPGLVQLEVNVIRWFCQMLGYPASAGGFLTSGGSLANLSAIVTARCERLPEDFLRGTIYSSDQVHHSILKAATLAGFPRRNVREVATDEGFRIDLGALEESIERDRAAGLEPFLLVASAGTTNTGAVDDLKGLAEIARRQRLWLHVDAAYGGFFALTERGARRLAGIERADSITLDPHKGLFLPYGTGCLLTRDLGALRRTHGLRAEYMPPPSREPGRVDFCDISPELSRDFRGLRVWLPLKLHGVDVFRRQLDEKLDLTAWATSELTGIEGVEIVAEPQLSIVAFRLRPPGMGREETNRANHELLERINARQNVFLTGTVLDGDFVLRICVLNFRTHMDRMCLALADIRASVAEALTAHG